MINIISHHIISIVLPTCLHVLVVNRIITNSHHFKYFQQNYIQNTLFNKLTALYCQRHFNVDAAEGKALSITFGHLMLERWSEQHLLSHNAL